MTQDEISKHVNKFERVPMSGCWLWTASVDKHGYGMLWNGKTMDRAHRMFFASATGQDVTGKNVLHDCDNPSCVNPDHLHIGTQKQNLKERTIRGRSGKKIDQQTADAIRSSVGTQRAIAKQFGVSQKQVWMIKKGFIWNAN